MNIVPAGRTASAGRIAPPRQTLAANVVPGPGMSTASFGAPVRGLVTSAVQDGRYDHSAVVCDNFWPTATGIEPRGGTRRIWSLPDGEAASGLFSHPGNTPTHFAVTAQAIYRLEGGAGNARVRPVQRGWHGAGFSRVLLRNTGGAHTLLVNGRDPALLYDGSKWHRAGEEGFTFSGIETSRLSHVFAYRDRLFFIEKDSLTFWYLPLAHRSGALERFPLDARFAAGGSLMTGAVWSSDSGAGLDDRIVFVTDRGEVAVYSGSDPGNAANWQSVGVYDMGTPLARNAHLNVGGELVLATQAGMIPLSDAVARDKTRLRLASLSAAIDDDWRSEAALASGKRWNFIKWPRANMALIAPPRRGLATPFLWAVNMHTQAFTRFTGWHIEAFGLLDDHLYYADHQGHIYQCDIGGRDDGTPFECRACLKFDQLSMPGRTKSFHTQISHWRIRARPRLQHSLARAFLPKFRPFAVRRARADFLRGSIWGTGQQAVIWNSATWGQVDLEVLRATRSSSGIWDADMWDRAAWLSDTPGWRAFRLSTTPGVRSDAVAPQLQLLSDSQEKVGASLVSVDLRFTPAGPGSGTLPGAGFMPDVPGGGSAPAVPAVPGPGPG